MKSEHDTAELHAMLSALLDCYDGVLIVAFDEDGASVVAGVAGGPETSQDDYRDLARSAPGAVAAWSKDALEDEVPAPQEAN